MSEEDDLRRGLHALVGNPPPVGPLAAGAIGRARASRTRQRAVVVAAALVVAAGGVGMVAIWRGGDQASPVAVPRSSAPATATQPAGTDPATPVVGTAYPYQLYVHCGVQYAKFGGRWWVATPQQSRPPAPTGRDGNYVTGTMTLTGTDRAHFRSTDPPLEVDFRPAPATPAPCD